MSFPDSKLNPSECDVDKVRIIVGDIDECDLEFSEDLYIYFLDSNDGDVTLAAIQALKALVAKYAKAAREAVGDVEVFFKERYEGYKDLLDSILNDPSYNTFGVIQPYAGGLSLDDKRSDALDSDLRSSPFSVGSAGKRAAIGYDAPFFKDLDHLHKI